MFQISFGEFLVTINFLICQLLRNHCSAAQTRRIFGKVENLLYDIQTLERHRISIIPDDPMTNTHLPNNIKYCNKSFNV